MRSPSFLAASFAAFVHTFRSLRPLDWLALFFAISVSAGFTFLARQYYGGSGAVAIQAEGTSYLYDLDTDRNLEFSGPLGISKIQIQDGRIRVLEDPGPQQICVRDGWIQESGEWLICLPNRIFIRIQGKPAQDGVDAKVY